MRGKKKGLNIDLGGGEAGWWYIILCIGGYLIYIYLVVLFISGTLVLLFVCFFFCFVIFAVVFVSCFCWLFVLFCFYLG